MAEHIALDKVELTLYGLIQRLRDEQEGFRELGHRLVNDRAKQFFFLETQVRAEYAAELENELHRMGVHDVEVNPSRAAKVSHFWAGMKSRLAAGDRDLLATAEEGEGEAGKAYEEALRQDLPLPLREILDRQQIHIQRSHKNVRALRDARGHSSTP
jgi:uncharacterized protein (TIGR02284 family)